MNGNTPAPCPVCGQPIYADESAVKNNRTGGKWIHERCQHQPTPRGQKPKPEEVGVGKITHNKEAFRWLAQFMRFN